MLLTIEVLFVILIVQSCSFGEKNHLSSGNTIQKSEICHADAGNTYEIYAPAISAGCIELPLLIIIDPQGEGKRSLQRFIPLADKYKLILASSNLIRNNFSGFPSALNLMLADIAEKYPVNDQLFLAGFSGGARMALTYSQYYQVNGVLAAGALSSPEQIAASECPVYALAGMADFNFIEAAQYLFRPDQAPDNLRMEFIGDSHAWPEEMQLQNALGYLILDRVSDKTECFDYTSLQKDYLNSQIKRIKGFFSETDYIRAYLLSQNLAFSSIFHSDAQFLSIYQSYNYDVELNDQMNDLKESIRFELESRERYYKTLFSENEAWWKTEIENLDTKIVATENAYESLAFERIKAFLGITCYSLTNNALNSNDLGNAAQLLPIYRLLEPQNPDMLYFSALYAKKSGDPEKARVLLQEALEAGFSDSNLIDNF